jgi:DivIVA domain-containing protein
VPSAKFRAVGDAVSLALASAWHDRRVVLVLEVLLAAAVVFAIVAFAAGRVDGMAPAPPDASPRPLPEAPLTSEQLPDLRFAMAFRGYRMADVDAFIERVGVELAERDAEIERLRRVPLEPVSETEN